MITRMGVWFVQPMLLISSRGEETLGAQIAFKLLLVHLIVFFFLIQSLEYGGTSLTSVDFGRRIEVNRHKDTSRTLFAHNNPRWRGRGRRSWTWIKMDKLGFWNVNSDGIILWFGRFLVPWFFCFFVTGSWCRWRRFAFSCRFRMRIFPLVPFGWFTCESKGAFLKKG